MFAERIRRLAEAHIPTVLLSGNHDLPSIAARATATDIYEALAIPYIFPARSPGSDHTRNEKRATERRHASLDSAKHVYRG